MNVHKNSTREQLKLQQWRENERYPLNGFEDKPACIRNDPIVSTIPYGKAVPCADALAHARPTTRKSTATLSASRFCRGNIAGSEREMHANGVFPYL